MMNVGHRKGSHTVMNPTRLVPLFIIALILAASFGPPAVAQVVDDFDSDPLTNADWEVYEPAASAEYSTDDGYFRVTLPAEVNLDTWVGVDNGIQIRRTDFPEDFIIETRIRIIGSGDPDDPIFPPLDESYLANLMVSFSQFDLYHWGPQRGTSLVNQRVANASPRCDEFNDLDEVSLQIRKQGSNYVFSWRPTDEEDWIFVCESQVAEPPAFVGLIFKTWNPPTTDRETFEFDYFKILENPAPRIGNFVPAAGENFHVAADGFEFTVEAIADGAEIDAASIQLMLNAVDVSDQLVVTGDAANPTVRFEGLEEGVLYSVEIEVSDTQGLSSRAIHSFGTLVEAEEEFFDDFDEDPIDTPGWSWYEPLTPVEYFVDDGFLRVTIPTGFNMDHWVAADRATMLRRSGLPRDFCVETRVRIVGSGFPDDPIFPPIQENYLANLIVQFSQFDLFHWGPQRGLNLASQRVGNTVPRCDQMQSEQELSLQIRKLGSEYTFAWRPTDDEPWIDLCTRTVTEPPLFVGLMFKTWQELTSEQTFEFEYFRIAEPSLTAPELSICESENDDPAWAGLPYIRSVSAGGFPVPTVEVVNGPPGLVYNSVTRQMEGWTPQEAGPVSYDVRATNSEGEVVITVNVMVSVPNDEHLDEFDDDPRENPDFEFYEPQLGTAYSLVDIDGDSWWRLEVPQAGDLGVSFDNWLTVDNAPQLRSVVEDESFVVETRVRIDPDTAPPAAAAFLAGLCLVYDQFDVLHWNIGQERRVGFSPRNLFLERSGRNNIALANVDGMIEGAPVDLRLERTCDSVRAFYRAAGDTEWILAGTHATTDMPLYAGLIIKTWGEGATFTADFDYFDVLTEGGPIIKDPLFKRGDADGANGLSLTDAVLILSFLFLGETAPSCLDAADADDNGAVALTDAVRILGYLFLGGEPPAAPGHLECGTDVNEESPDLGCRSFNEC
jgi:hypothetical protein